MRDFELDLSFFTDAYVECAFWLFEPETGTPVMADLSEDAMSRIEADCRAFYSANFEAIGEHIVQAGHDFWLTRNGHGAGFWDRTDDVWDKPTRDRLTEAAKAMGECSLYFGDSGEVEIG
jgi:hypothetical protein